MINLQVSAFHLDFSTLEIEKGVKAVLPSGISYVIHPTTFQPLIKVESLVLENEPQVSSPKS